MPSSVVAEALRSAWAQILGCDSAEVQDNVNFFEAGGDSVSAIKLITVAKKHGVSLSAQMIFNHPVFGDLLNAANDAQHRQSKDQKPNSNEVTAGAAQQVSLMAMHRLIQACLTQCQTDPALLEDLRPCAPFQTELLRATNNLGVWTFQAVFETSANARDRAKLAVDLLHEKNAVFRAKVAEYDCTLYQVVSKALPAWQEVHEPLAAFKARDLNVRMSYGLPLSRCTLVNDRDRTYIVWTKNHGIYDRWSKGHVIDDVLEAFIDPDAFRRKPPRTSFMDFCQFCETQDREKARKYWLDQLSGLVDYQHLFEAAPIKDFKTSETKEVRRSTTYRKPTKTHITFATVCHLAWAVILSRESGAADIFYNSLRSCRQMELDGIDDIIGPLWSLVPFRMQLHEYTTLQEALEGYHKAMVEGIPYEPFGIDALEDYFRHKGFLQSVLLVQPPQPDFSRSVTVKDTKTNDDMSIRSAGEQWTQTRSHYGCYIALTPIGDRLEAWVRFDESVMPMERVEQLTEDYLSLLDTMFDMDWKTTAISDLCPSISTSNGLNHAESDEEYQIEGVDTSKPSTLRYLLNQRAGKATACIMPTDPTLEVSYDDLEKHVGALQKSLAALGIQQGSPVSMSLGNTYELIVAFLASARQRAIAAPLNPAYKQEEIEFYVDDLQSDLVLIPRGKFAARFPAVAAARKYGAAVAEVSHDAKAGEVVLDVKDRGKLADAKPHDVLEAEESDTALILHTSGTTGRPKAVPLTHKNLLTSVGDLCRTYRLRAADRTVLIMPLFHIHGLVASFLSVLRAGSTAIIPERLTPDFWRMFAAHGATWYSATPTMHRMILGFPAPDGGLPRIRFIRSCSSQLSPALFAQLHAKFCCPVVESYAMTEASHLMTSNPLARGAQTPGSVGLPQGVDLKILSDDNAEVPRGHEGEVSIRGANVTPGYLNNEDANRTSFTPDRFFRTGDQGKLDPETGYLYLTGRLKELINKGGEKISPVELDNALSQHEAVAECVSFAIDDEDYGQDVGAAIKLHDGTALTANELRKWAAGKLASHKVPRKIWFPQEIPKTATGKVQRRLVADKLAAEEPA